MVTGNSKYVKLNPSMNVLSATKLKSGMWQILWPTWHTTLVSEIQLQTYFTEIDLTKPTQYGELQVVEGGKK